jgi:integrase
MENPETGRPYKNLAKGWARITQRAGLAGIRIHDMRHTFASWSLQNGIDPITSQTLPGHRTASMTKRYAHLNKEALIAAIDHFARSANSDTRATVFVRMSQKSP